MEHFNGMCQKKKEKIEPLPPPDPIVSFSDPSRNMIAEHRKVFVKCSPAWYLRSWFVFLVDPRLQNQIDINKVSQNACRLAIFAVIHSK